MELGKRGKKEKEKILCTLARCASQQKGCAVPVLATGGLAEDCSSLKRSTDREREGPHSADQMTSLLQLMFSGTQTQG